MNDLCKQNFKINWTALVCGHPNKGILDLLQNKITATRAPVKVPGIGPSTINLVRPYVTM